MIFIYFSSEDLDLDLDLEDFIRICFGKNHVKKK